MSLRLGRVSALPEPLSWSDSGGRITVHGNYRATSLTDGLVKRDQLLGLKDNWDEPIIPIVMDNEPRVTGYYRILDVAFATDEFTRLAGNLYDYRVELERVQGFAQPILESVFTGALLTNVVGAVQADMHAFHAVPSLATEYGQGSTTLAIATRVAADGALNYITVGGGALFPTTASFYLPPKNFYLGAATIEQGSPLQPVVGRVLAQSDPANWRLSNGLVRVTPNPTYPGQLDVSHFVAPLYSDFETAGTTQTLFKSLGTDATGTLNAWVLGGSPSIAANVLTLPVNASVRGGHPDWTDITFQCRFKWSTGTTPLFNARLVDANNQVYAQADGTTLYLIKAVAGSFTTVASAAAALVNGTQYWMQIVVVGTTYTLKIFADTAGAITLGTQIGSTVSGTISDAAVQSGQIALQAGLGTCIFGGAFATVCTVTGTAPSGWTATINAGEPAFCWSKKRSYSGAASASIFNAHSSANGYWLSAASTTIAAVSYVLTAQMWGSGTPSAFDVESVGASLITSPAPAPATSTWQAMSGTGIPGAAIAFALLAGGAGTYYFDNVQVGTWATAKTYKFTGVGTFPRGAINAFIGTTVLRNSVEESTIRLSCSTVVFGPAVFLDITLRRGDRLARCYLSCALPDKWAVFRNTAEAATAITYAAVTLGGIRATANDADGNRYILLSYQAAATNDLVNGGLTQTAALQMDIGIGSEIGGSASTGDDAAVRIAENYIAAQSESQRVVSR